MKREALETKAEGSEAAPGAGADDLQERWSVQRKMELVLRLLRGEGLHGVSRERQVRGLAMQHDRPNDLVAGSVDSAHRRQSFSGVALRVIAVAFVLTLPFLPVRVDTVRADPSDTVRLRVLTMNLWGLRYPSKQGSTPDESDCAGRLKAAAQRIRSADPPYDIVGIQELYSLPGTIACDPAPFLGELGAAGSPGMRKVLFAPKGRTREGEADGGIGIITPHTIEQHDSRRFVGAGATLVVARGALFARVAIGSGLNVDVYVIHLSPGREKAAKRKRELAALAKLIAAKSSASGSPVLVMGDFNIAGPPPADGEYRTILQELRNPRDLWLASNPSDPGFTYDCLTNPLAALRGCHFRARFDYLLSVADRSLSNSDDQVNLDKEHAVRRVMWTTEGQHPLPVSDHYGLEATLWVERKPGAKSSR